MRLLGIAAFLVSGVVAAADLSELETRQTVCQGYGRIAAGNFMMKARGQAYQAPPRDIGPVTRVLGKYSSEYGYNQASSAEDAFRTSFAKCWDNLNRLQREEAIGKTELELQ